MNFSAIERDFTRVHEDGAVDKVMTRTTIKKYFNYLLDKGLIKFSEADGYYYLTVLEGPEAHLIEYNTLTKLMNVLQKRSLTIYAYLFNRYYANGCNPFIATRNQIKDYIGFCQNSGNNDNIIADTIDILSRLGLLSMKHITKDGKTYMQFLWVRNELPSC